MEINIQNKNVQKPEVIGLSALDFQQVIGLSTSEFQQVIGLSTSEFQQVIGLSTSEFQQVIGLSTSEFQQVIGLSTSEFQQVIGLSTSVIGLSVPSTRCMCVGNPNYNGSVRLQYTAGGAGDTDESGTNKDAHQLSVIWQKDASATPMGSISIVMEFFVTNLDEATPGLIRGQCATAALTKFVAGTMLGGRLKRKQFSCLHRLRPEISVILNDVTQPPEVLDSFHKVLGRRECVLWTTGIEMVIAAVSFVGFDIRRSPLVLIVSSVLLLLAAIGFHGALVVSQLHIFMHMLLATSIPAAVCINFAVEDFAGVFDGKSQTPSWLLLLLLTLPYVVFLCLALVSFMLGIAVAELKQKIAEALHSTPTLIDASVGNPFVDGGTSLRSSNLFGSIAFFLRLSPLVAVMASASTLADATEYADFAVVAGLDVVRHSYTTPSPPTTWGDARDGVVPRIDPFKGFKYAGVQTHGHIFIATFVALHRSFDGRPPPPAKKQLSVFESYGGVWCALVTPRAKEPWGQTKRTAPGWLARRHLSPGKMLCAAGRAFALCPSRASKKRLAISTKVRCLDEYRHERQSRKALKNGVVRMLFCVGWDGRQVVFRGAGAGTLGSVLIGLLGQAEEENKAFWLGLVCGVLIGIFAGILLDFLYLWKQNLTLQVRNRLASLQIQVGKNRRE
ncbi:hypothetical protein AK812_SmicGene41880 [Symbiodinium microadriaticum]|uniref:Uncharacterized protein n=1 Tax=Symbiodinium microadriaticum TaxID=2951 RepID=A0A1Q9C506_SYMMI|nr:hypothetical protein AK812_SmicGene41880 [Symbiodinium microadriaticum]